MATYYVDKTSGSANDSNAGTDPNFPWLTIGKACTTMVAGDITYVKGDNQTYSISSTLSFSNTGNPTASIQLLRFSTHNVTIQPSVSINYVFNMDKNYVIVDGFRIVCSNGSSITTGDGVTIAGSYNQFRNVYLQYAGAFKSNPQYNGSGFVVSTLGHHNQFIRWL